MIYVRQNNQRTVISLSLEMRAFREDQQHDPAVQVLENFETEL